MGLQIGSFHYQYSREVESGGQILITLNLPAPFLCGGNSVLYSVASTTLRVDVEPVRQL